MESAGQQIGEIDGKLIGFGYNAYLSVTEPSLAAHSDFLDLVTLFATSVGYHRAIRRSLKKRMAAAGQGDAVRHIIEDEEFWLLKKPPPPRSFARRVMLEVTGLRLHGRFTTYMAVRDPGNKQFRPE